MVISSEILKPNKIAFGIWNLQKTNLYKKIKGRPIKISFTDGTTWIKNK